LPPVFSVVLYTGESTWGSGTNLRQLLGQPEVFHPFTPDWGPVFWSLADRSPAQLLAGGAWIQLMAVMRVTSAEWVDFERVYTDVMRHLAAIHPEEPVRWYELLSMVLHYATWRRPRGESNVLVEIAERENPARQMEVRHMGQTIAEAYEARGEVRQSQRLLLALLRKRFGELPAPLIEQIQAITEVAPLEAAFDRAVDVGLLEEFRL
jgi:hypothetical protein